MSASEPASANGPLEGSKVGHRLRSQRERLGIGLRELARRVGVSPSLVSQIELDRVNPSVSTLYALVTELGMTMSDVFGEQAEERVVRSRATASRNGPRRDLSSTSHPESAGSALRTNGTPTWSSSTSSIQWELRRVPRTH